MVSGGGWWGQCGENREPVNVLGLGKGRIWIAKASKGVGVSTGAFWLYLGEGSVCAGSVKRVGSVEGLWV